MFSLAKLHLVESKGYDIDFLPFTLTLFLSVILVLDNILHLDIAFSSLILYRQFPTLPDNRIYRHFLCNFHFRLSYFDGLAYGDGLPAWTVSPAWTVPPALTVSPAWTVSPALTVSPAWTVSSARR